MNEIDPLFVSYSAVTGVDSLRVARPEFRTGSTAARIAVQSPVSDLRANAAEVVSAFDLQARSAGFDRSSVGEQFLDNVGSALLDLQRRGTALDARARNLGSDPNSYLKFMADALHYQREAELFIQGVRALTSIVPQITQMQG